MKILYADSGSTKTQWLLMDDESGLSAMTSTQGLNPVHVTPEAITEAVRGVVAKLGRPDEVRFYGSGCAGERIQIVERALRKGVAAMIPIAVDGDLMCAALALGEGEYIGCIMGTGAIASLVVSGGSEVSGGPKVTPLPALGYILGDEGSGTWFGRHLIRDYFKQTMPKAARQAFEEDYGVLDASAVIRRTYHEPQANAFLASFAPFVGRHPELDYARALAFTGIEEFWKNNVLMVAKRGLSRTRDVRLVGSVAFGLQDTVKQVAELYDYEVKMIIKEPLFALSK